MRVPHSPRRSYSWKILPRPHTKQPLEMKQGAPTPSIYIIYLLAALREKKRYIWPGSRERARRAWEISARSVFLGKYDRPALWNIHSTRLTGAMRVDVSKCITSARLNVQRREVSAPLGARKIVSACSSGRRKFPNLPLIRVCGFSRFKQQPFM